MLVSIIVPCRNEERYIAACLDSILAGDWPHDRLEILVVDGQSDDDTRAIVEAYAERHPFIRLLDNPRRIVPAALNRGIEAACGDIVARMDAHAVYPRDYLTRLVEALEATGADNVGGCIETLPSGRGHVARAVAIALSHPLGVGNSYFRIGAEAPRRIDTVPFGCWPRTVFRRVGLFDEELVRNQDDEFNHRIIRQGGIILLLPDVVTTYYARDTLGKMARMYYQYGWFKPLVAKKVGRVMTLRQLVPPAFLLALAGLGLLGLVSTTAALLWTLLLASYLLLVTAGGLWAARRQGPVTGLALAVAFATLHASYGLGFLRGILNTVRGPGAARANPAAVPLSR